MKHWTLISALFCVKTTPNSVPRTRMKNSHRKSLGCTNVIFAEESHTQKLVIKLMTQVSTAAARNRCDDERSLKKPGWIISSALAKANIRYFVSKIDVGQSDYSNQSMVNWTLSVEMEPQMCKCTLKIAWSVRRWRSVNTKRGFLGCCWWSGESSFLLQAEKYRFFKQDSWS